MEHLLELLPSLTGPQIEAITHVATAMLYSNPAQQDEYMTVAQIHEEFGRPPSSVYSAQDRGLLTYTTPEGQTRPRYSKRMDVLRWLGRA